MKVVEVLEQVHPGVARLVNFPQLCYEVRIKMEQEYNEVLPTIMRFIARAVLEAGLKEERDIVNFLGLDERLVTLTLHRMRSAGLMNGCEPKGSSLLSTLSNNAVVKKRIGLRTFCVTQDYEELDPLAHHFENLRSTEPELRSTFNADKFLIKKGLPLQTIVSEVLTKRHEAWVTLDWCESDLSFETARIYDPCTKEEKSYRDSGVIRHVLEGNTLNETLTTSILMSRYKRWASRNGRRSSSVSIQVSDFRLDEFGNVDIVARILGPGAAFIAETGPIIASRGRLIRIKVCGDKLPAIVSLAIIEDAIRRVATLEQLDALNQHWTKRFQAESGITTDRDLIMQLKCMWAEEKEEWRRRRLAELRQLLESRRGQNA